MSLAHNGVLFLDELPEFSRTTLEALRQPIEDGWLEIARVSGRARFPSEVLLVGASNPCPCGWYGVGERCRCSRSARERYATRLSGPLRDRFDLRVELQAVDPEALVGDGEDPPFPSGALEAAREHQRRRSVSQGHGVTWNARIPGSELPGAAQASREALGVLVQAGRHAHLTGRGLHRCLRVARTIADLHDAPEVQARDIKGALMLRT